MLEGDYRDHPGHSYAPVERKSVHWFTRCMCANKSPTATRWNRSRALMAAARSFEANFGRAIRIVTAKCQTWFHRLGQSAHIQPNPCVRNVRLLPQKDDEPDDG
jgi:hypothetical protein